MSFQKILSFFCFSILCSYSSLAQLPNGSTAPNWTLTDLNGTTHTLYDYLDQGKMVIIDFSATWCGPCWNYHNSHAIRDFYDNYGPNGTDEAMAFFIEGDLGTNTNCLYGSTGCNNSTWGNWVAGTTYPIISLQPTDQNVTNDYQIGFWPTIYAICPNRKVYEIGAVPTHLLVNWLTSCSLDATSSSTDILCYGDGSGTIDLDVSGGRPNISYSWNNGDNTQDLSNLDPGNYTCTITEGQGHSVVVGPINIAGPSAALDVQLNSLTNVDCNGNANGAINLSAIGGTSGYQYLWDDNDTSSSRSNLSGGNYNLTVTDLNGCTTEDSYTVIEPPALTLNVIATNENCGNNDGTLLLDGDGGSSTLLYDIGQGPSPNQYYQNLPSGTYFVTVTDGNACSTASVGVINDNPGPVADAGPDQSIDCANNVVDLDGSNSEVGPNITYLWTTTDGNILNGENTLTPSVDAVGTYLLLVTNSDNNCSELSSVSVTGDVDAPLADAGDDGTLNCTVSSIVLDGSASSSGSNFSYQWTTTDGNIVNGGDSPTPTVDAAGTYNLVVSNTANGCTASASAQVLVDDLNPMADAGADGQLDCTNTSLVLDGSASSSGSNFSYQWTTTDGNIVNGGDSPTPTVDAAGTYNLVVSNTANGCTASASAQVVLDDLNPMADAGSDGQIDCTNTSLVLDGSASSSGNNFSYQWTTTDGNIVNGGDTPTPTVDAAGTYNLLVSNTANGCTATAAAQVVLNDANPVADAGADALLNCNTSAVTLDGSSSSIGNNFSYQWSTTNGNIVNGENSLSPMVDAGGTYTLVVSDSNNGCSSSSSVVVNIDNNTPSADAGDDGILNCNQTSLSLDGSASSSGSNFSYSWTSNDGNILNGEDSPSPTVDAAGTYNLVVTNNTNGCTASASVNVSEDTVIPTADALADDMLTCNVLTVVIDGTASSVGDNFSYQWSTTNGNILNGETGLIPEVDQAGDYTLLVTNQANGCESSITVQVDEDIVAPAADATVNGQLDCNTSTISLDGTASSTGTSIGYQWSTTNGNILNGETSLTPEVDQAGDYMLIVTNLNNACTASDMISVTEDTDYPTADAGTAESFNCNTTTITLDGTNSSSGSNFSYLWTSTNGNILNGENTLSPSIDAPGDYMLQVTNSNNGCQTNASITVNQTPDLSVAIDNQNNNACYDDANGSVSLDLDGGNPPYTISWTNGETGASIDNLAAGTYTANIVDEDNCTQSINVTITEPDLLNANSNATDVSSAGANDGTATANPDGGMAPYSYNWSTGASTMSISNLAPGTYTVTVNDVNQCESIETVTVSSFNCAISASIDPISISCNGANDGAASINVLGGTSPFSYLWSNGETTASINNLAAGNYTVTITDDNNCPTTENINISEPAAISLSIADQQDVDCFGNQNGMITIAAEGGTNGLQYLWESGNTTATETNLTAGSYTVSVSDGNNCMTSQTIEVTTPPVISINPTNIVQIDCHGNDSGEITVSADGGVGNFSYQWESGNNAATESGLGAGEYFVTVTDGNQCASVTSINLDNPPLLELNLESTQDVACFGEASGAASVAGNGGTGMLSFIWDNGATTSSISNLSAGDYQVSVSDENNCQTSLSLSIEQASLLEVDLSSTGETALNANDGTASASAIGGMGSYTYLWSTGQTEAVINDLVPGTYHLTVTDANNCMSFASTTVEAFSCAISASLNKTNVSCHSLANGSASIDILLGQAPFSYSWSNGATSQSINNLTAGDYAVTATDVNNCPEILSFTITEPEALEVSVADQTNVSCFGDQNASISLETNGGTGNHFFNWSQGANTAQVDQLAAGTYTVSVSDNNECLTTLDIVITEPDALAANASATGETQADGNDGTATAEPQGGTQPYTYYWDNGAETQSIENLMPGAYTVTVVDVNQCASIQTVNVNSFNCAISSAITANAISCNGLTDGTATVEVLAGQAPYQYEWSNGSTEASLSDLSSGTYSVTVTDDNNCPAYLTVTVDEPEALNIEISDLTAAACNGEASGAASITVNGGTGNYTYNWSNGGTTASIDELSSGEYEVTVTDLNNCMITESITIDEPTAINIEITDLIHIACANDNTGGANAVVSGGMGTYSFEWSNGSTESSVSSLSAGIHELMITDGNNCVATQSFEILADDQEAPEVLVMNQTIYLNNNGEASITASQVDNGSNDNCGIETLVLSQTSFDCSQIGENTIELTATDFNGNSNMAQVIITVEDLINPTISCPNNIETNACDELVTYELPAVSDNCVVLDATLINGLGSGANFPVGVSTEIYQVQDEYGNTATCSFTITVNNTLDASVAAESTCLNGATGSASVQANGGTPNYTYLWNTGATTSSIDELAEDSYSVTVTDATGCSYTETVEVSSYPEISLKVDAVQAEQGGNANGAISISVLTGTAPYNYEWILDGEVVSTEEDPTGLSAGSYICIITDANGCTFTSDEIIVESTTSFIDPNLANYISVFPNPTSGTLNVNFSLNTAQEVQISIYDPVGRLLNQTIEQDISSYRFVFDLADYTNGVYFIKAQVGDGIFVKKVVLHRK